ncbi:unnamed protein product [Caenorhabditis bovis]|uniref:GDP-fucose protein O-fucosyltransferase 1 n=1 Tax=Caenorhabditis bovis TaxID=2654633 RepID=A0A8S1EGL3_9PELO|nr:unnamed protein product [Caenorhabditis bovis]
MSAVEKLTAELNSERQKLALYEKNLRIAVESCKALKAEKENLSNIIAGFVGENDKPASDIEKLRQQVAELTKEFQSKENALILARTTVLKENTDLKQKLKQLQSSNSSSANNENGGQFMVAELEQKLRKEISINRKYEKRLQQLEEQIKQNGSMDLKIEKMNKTLEEEREQFKKLYEDAHGRSIYLERKLASLQLDQKKSAAEAPKENSIDPGKREDDFRVIKLEHQIMILSEQCDKRENEIIELNALVSKLKAENADLREQLNKVEILPNVATQEEKSFIDLMNEEYLTFRQSNLSPLDFCCGILRDDISELIKNAQSVSEDSEQLKMLQSRTKQLEKTVEQLNAKLEEEDAIKTEITRKLNKLDKIIEQKDEFILQVKEEVNKLKNNLMDEKIKGNELENEVSKQRQRAQEEIDSRDREIEAFRKMLVSFRNEKMEKSQSSRKLSRHNRSTTPEEDVSHIRRSRTFSQDDSIAADPDAKNVYYENQISKKESDIQDLRKQLMDLEVRLRESEAISMTKQLESVAKVDELTENVRKLEGKLQMLSSSNEIDYLRNIFTQYLQTMSSPNMQSKAILKAMGSVLKKMSYKYSRLNEQETLEDGASTQQILQRQEKIIRDQDVELELVSNSVRTLKGMSAQIGDELEEQAIMLDELGQDMEHVDTKLDGVMKKMAKLAHLEDDASQCKMIFILSALLFFLLFVLIVLGYIVFCPCMGRFGNQVDQLLGVMEFAKSIDRLLVLPNFIEYDYPNTKIVPFENIFQISYIEQYVHTISMFDFVRNFYYKAFCWTPKKSIYNKTAPDGCHAKEGSPFGPYWDKFKIEFIGDEYFADIPGGFDTSQMGNRKGWMKKYPIEEYRVLAFPSAPAPFPSKAKHWPLQKHLVWNSRIKQEAKKFIDKNLRRPYLGVHLRNDRDWLRVCEHIDEKKNLPLFASAQCLGEGHHKGILTKDMCLPSPKDVIDQITDQVGLIGAKSVFVTSDRDHMLSEINAALQAYDVKAYRLDQEDMYVALVILGQSDMFLGNCVSTFSHIVKRERDHMHSMKLPSTYFGMPTIREHFEL